MIDAQKKLDIPEEFKRWQRRILISVWVTYASFYLCRVNMSVAMPGIMKEFSISKTSMGMVLTALFFAYAVGQFINGQLGDKYGARKLVSLGALVSAGLNIVFSFLPGILTVMMIVWGLNGYFQSMGWSPSVKTVGNWFPLKQRGKACGILGSSYQIGNVASWALAGLVVTMWGWRSTFYVPAIILGVIAIHWYLRGRNAPEEVGLPTIEELDKGSIERKDPQKDHHLGFSYTLKTVLANRRVWQVGLALFGLNIVRYGFMSWAPTYMVEERGATESFSAYLAIAIPLFGSVGALFAGWASDRFFGSRRAPVTVMMLAGLMFLALLYPRLGGCHWIWSLLCLGAIGFATYGPHVMVVGAAPMDYTSRKAAASAVGFVDALGYFGASLTGVITGALIDAHGWDGAFYFWVSGVALAIVMMVSLWKYLPRKGEYH